MRTNKCNKNRRTIAKNTKKPSQTKNSKPRSDKENDPAISAINKLLKKGHNGKCAGPDAELGIES